jgi:pimeloyl-ACP methyl ester carboxylesterase
MNHKPVAMKQGDLLLFSIIISSFLVFISCEKEPNHWTSSFDGVEISFDKQGRGSPVIVFVHGWSNNRSVWDEQMAHFSNKYKVIAIDLGGHGQSGDDRNVWSMSSFSEDVIAVINHLKLKKVILVGFSMGGPVVIEAAKKAPEKIAGLVLVDNLHNIEVKYSEEMTKITDSIFSDLIAYPTNEKLLNLGFYKNNPEKSFQRVMAMFKDGQRPGRQESFFEMFKWINEDLTTSLIEIHSPVISINSNSQPTNIEAFQKYIPSYNVHVMSDVGHLVFWDAPGEFNNLLEQSIQEFIGN